jgi:hypothetical protein
MLEKPQSKVVAMATESEARRLPVRLSYSDGQVIVTPDDQVVFFNSAEKATEACKEAVRNDERISHFKAGFIVPMRAWCVKNKHAISACYLAFPESSILPVYVIGAGEQYDFELTKELSKMSCEFDSRGWAVLASQIPLCCRDILEGYFSFDESLQIYA